MIHSIRLLPSLTLVMAFVATAASSARPLPPVPHTVKPATTHVAVRCKHPTNKFVALSKVEMIATAYTAHDYGCSGITAMGLPAGRGIVAVDPRVIPLGTRLYISGYGYALAGDTGGAIRGNRVDLGFNSYRDAIRFGRREVTVYRLK